MNYGRLTAETARYAYQNLVGLFTISVFAVVTLLPLGATIAVGTPLALLGGLWTTSLFGGVVAIGAMHFSTVVVERGVSVPVRPSLAAAVRSPRPGLLVGVITFAVAVAALSAVTTAPASLRTVVAGVVGFLVSAWFLLVAFGSPELGGGRSLSNALAASASRIGRGPGAVAWFLVLSFACTMLAGVTVVTLLLFLPGVLALLAARAASMAESAE